jgi:predicted aspartyl protease
MAALFVIALGVDPVAFAASNCKLVSFAELPVLMAHSKVIVDGSINGTKVRVLVDTGAPHTSLLRSAAIKFGLERQQAGGYSAYGVGGATTIETGFVEEFGVGQATRKGLRMMIIGENDLGDDVAALLGDDFLSQFEVEFDLPHRMLRLFQALDCAGVSLGYWAPKDVSVVEMEAFNPAAPQVVLPVTINGQPVRALLDSGAGRSVLGKSVAARLGVTPDTPGTVSAGQSGGLGPKSVETWRGIFKSFVIGDEMITDTTITFGEIWKDATYTPPGSHLAKRVEGAEEMLLGADFLLSHRLLIAHSQRKVYFSHVGGPVFYRPPPANPPVKQ